MRYLVFAVLFLLFAVGAMAAGFVPVPWTVQPKTASKSERQEPQNSEQSAKDKQKNSDGTETDNPSTGKTKIGNAATDNSKIGKSANPDAALRKQQLAEKQPSQTDQPEFRNKSPGKSRVFGIDVARINPDGDSVIAGFAAPSSRVSVLANDKVIGTTVADPKGDWVLVTSHKFANTDPKLTLKRTQDEGGNSSTNTAAGPTADPAPSNSMNEPKGKGSAAGAKPQTASNAPRRTADHVTSEMMQRLRKLTRDAEEKRGAQEQPAKAAKNATTQSPIAMSVPKSVSQTETATAVTPPSSGTKVAYRKPSRRTEQSPIRAVANETDALPLAVLNSNTTTNPAVPVAPTQVAAATPAPVARINPSRPSTKLTESLPVPVQFVFRKPVFTKQGREAAELLLAYLKANAFKAVTLSGHADERGTSDANKRLSKQRLDTLEQFLRDGGFNGRLKLVPKGESEHYTGVDRSQFPVEELYQLDRRVEVVAAQ